MSNHSPLSNDSITPSTPAAEDRRWQFIRSLKKPMQFLAFWVAVTLPFVHLPLVARGLGDPNALLTFLLLLVINVLALYVGHGYNQSEP